MTLALWKINRFPLAAGWLVMLALCGAGNLTVAGTVVLHLRGGDQVTGVVLSEDAQQLVISNAWVHSLSVPLASIAQRELVTNAPAVAASAPPPPAKPAEKPAAPAKPVELAKAKSPPPPASLPKPKPRGKWNGQASVGLNALLGTTSQQNYFGNLKLTYARPYAGNPKKFFRNTSEFTGQYQRTDGQESANRASANDKADFDIGTKSYGYCSGGIGFDEVRKVDLRYLVGPGMGSHLIRSDDTALNIESGLNYEAQYRRDTDNLESFFLRLAQDWTWSIQKNLKLVERLQFLPNLEPMDFGQYQAAFSSTLSYGFWQNLSLDLTAEDNYDTQAAPGVGRNEFQVRLTLGATF
jgi:putative salt-induced outer membrane protein YdiY